MKYSRAFIVWLCILSTTFIGLWSTSLRKRCDAKLSCWWLGAYWRRSFARHRRRSIARRRLGGNQRTIQAPRGIFRYTPWMPGGSFCGTRGQSRRLEGFAIRLNGPNAARYDVFYSGHLQDVGDVGPLKDGDFCGTRGQSRRLEAMVVWVKARAS